MRQRKFSVMLPPGPREGEVHIPASKSVAHRLLICAALGQTKTALRIEGFSRDILATVACLKALGAGIENRKDVIRVTPIRKPVSGGMLPCGESGSTLRFLLPVVGALGVSGYFRMEGRLPERPMQAYEDLLLSRDPIVSTRAFPTALKLWAGPLDTGDWRVNPMTGDLKALPPMLIFAGGHEAMEMGIRQFVEEAIRQDADVVYYVKNFEGHAYVMYYPYAKEERQMIVNRLLG